MRLRDMYIEVLGQEISARWARTRATPTSEIEFPGLALFGTPVVPHVSRPYRVGGMAALPTSNVAACGGPWCAERIGGGVGYGSAIGRRVAAAA